MPKQTAKRPRTAAPKLITGAASGQSTAPVISHTIVKSIGRQFFVNISLFGDQIRFLVDTGSQLNLIQECHIPKGTIIHQSDLRVQNYSGGDVKISGYIESEFKIDNISWGKSRFYVVSNNLYSILGSASLEENEIIVNLHRGKLIQSGPVERFAKINKIGIKEEADFDFQGVSTQNYTFRGKSECMIDLRVNNLTDTAPLFFETSELRNSKLELIPSFQVVSPDNPIFRLLVLNPTDQTIKITANTVYIKLFKIAEIANLKTDEKFEKIKNSIPFGAIKNLKIQKEFEELVKKYSFLFLEDGDFLPACNITKFSINTNCKYPIATAPYRTPYALRGELKSIIKDFLDNDIIEPCTSSWNSPILLVKKQNGKFRLVVDFRKLNNVTEQVNYPLPNLEDSLSLLEKSRIFSACDLMKGFYQVALEPESAARTAFSCEYGQFSFKRMPMGCRNSPAVFCKIMDTALKDIDKSEVLSYMDDVVIHSVDEENHLINLKKFFQVCAVNNLRINIKKVNFFGRKLEFCGYEISDGYYKPSSTRIESIKSLAIPRNKDECLSLFGALSYHRKFLPNFSAKALPITRTYRGPFLWTQEASRAFENLKREICEKVLDLKIPPLDDCLFVLETDASSEGFGGVLYVCNENNQSESHNHSENCLRPTAYYSLNFTESQLNYCTVEKELLAAKKCMERWAVFLKFRRFHWLTDNGNISYCKTLKTNNNKIQRWVLELQAFDFRVIQKKSAQMQISDYLSRHNAKPIAEIAKLQAFKNEFSEMQILDPVLSQIIKFVKIDRWPNKPSPDQFFYALLRKNLNFYKNGELAVFYDEGPRICVPEALIPKIMAEYHNNCHTGIEQTYTKVRSKYIWPKMKECISEFVRTCVYCQSNKPNTNPNRPPIKSFPTPSGPYEVFGIDLIGPLSPTDSGNHYCLTMVDFFSKFGYAEPLMSKKAPEVLSQFKKILFRNPKFPKFVVLDNGLEFRAVADYLSQNNISPHFAPPRHPACNGAVEVFNRTLKSRLQARTNFENWDNFLYEVLHEINSNEHSVTKLPPFTVQTGIKNCHSFFDPNFRFYGDKIEINYDEIRRRIDMEKQSRISKFDNVKFKEYQIGELVLIKNFRSGKPPFIGPFKITKKSAGGVNYECFELDTGKTFRRHAEAIKVFHQRESEAYSETSESNDYEINEDCLTETFEQESIFPTLPFLAPKLTAKQNSNAAFLENVASGLIDNTVRKIVNEFLTKFYDQSKMEENHKFYFGDVLEELKSNVERAEIKNSMEDFDRQTAPEGIPENFLRIFENSYTENSIPQNSPRNLEQFSEIVTPDHLQNITVSDTESVEDANKLTSYDKLNLVTQSGAANLRQRKLVDYFETTEESSSEAESVISVSKVARKREREPSENSVSPVDSKNARLSLENDFSNLTMTLKLENEDKEFFNSIKRIEEIDICPDMIVENHCLLKLSTLPKDVLLFLAVKFNLPVQSCNTKPVLTLKIKRHLKKEFPNWRKSETGEYLFFASFRVKEQISLYSLNVPELKTVCAAFKLDKIPGNSKTLLQQFIVEQFEIKYPRHPKIKHELIFLPDAPESP